MKREWTEESFVMQQQCCIDINGRVVIKGEMVDLLHHQELPSLLALLYAHNSLSFRFLEKEKRVFI